MPQETHRITPESTRPEGSGGHGRRGAGRDSSRPRPEAMEGDRARDMRDLEFLALWLDSRFRVPGTRIRFGLDSLLGLVPGIGDAATTLPAAYILYRAHGLGVPRRTLARMGWNVGVDLVVGAIPVLGDIFDLGFKANRRNVALLRRHLGEPPRTRPHDPVRRSP